MSKLFNFLATILFVMVAIAGLAMAMLSAYSILTTKLALELLIALAIGTALCLLSIMFFGIAKDNLHRKNA